jgi:RNA polymerase sigma-70 factor, ECF subfamily
VRELLIVTAPRASGEERVLVEQAFAENERQLGRFLAQVVRDRALAEDLLQETFLVAVQGAATLRSREKAKAWLFGIAHNRALKALRAGRRERTARERLAHARLDPVSDPSEAVFVRDFLAAALDADDRLLLVLRYVHGFDGNELGRIVGARPEAVRQRLSRARRRLLRALDEQEGLPDSTPRSDEPPADILVRKERT